MTEDKTAEVRAFEEISDTDIDIERAFAEFGPGYRIQIHRSQPHEFRGFLEEIVVSDTVSPIDLDYLTRTWGGRELKLKIKRPNGQYLKTLSIQLFSYPPLLYGEKLEKPKPPFFGEAAQPLTAPIAPNSPPPPPQDIAELLNVLQKFRTSDTELLSSLLQRSGSTPTPHNPYTQLNQMIDTLARLQGLMTPQSAPSQSPDDAIFSQISHLVELALKPKPAPIVQTGQQRPGNPPAVQPTLPAIDPESLVKSLADADPRMLAALMSETLRQMPWAKRRTAIDTFDEVFSEYDEDQDEEKTETGS